MFQPIRSDHVMVSAYSTSLPWSRDESRLSIHIMWSIPQLRDIQSRKLKTIKYSVCDRWGGGMHRQGMQQEGERVCKQCLHTPFLSVYPPSHANTHTKGEGADNREEERAGTTDTCRCVVYVLFYFVFVFIYLYLLIIKIKYDQLKNQRKRNLNISAQMTDQSVWMVWKVKSLQYVLEKSKKIRFWSVCYLNIFFLLHVFSHICELICFTVTLLTKTLHGRLSPNLLAGVCAART